MDQGFLIAVWKWVEACEASYAAGGAGSAVVEWEAVKIAAADAGISSANLSAAVTRAMNFKFPGGSFRAYLAALESTWGGLGGAGGGAAAGTASVGGILIGLGLCIVVGTVALGVHTLMANARDARRARKDSEWLWTQYLGRYQRFQLDLLRRRPSRNFQAPMSFNEWLANQGSKITVM